MLVNLHDPSGKNLAPWQIDQATTLDRILFRCYDEYAEPLDHWDQTEFILLERLTASQYANSYYALIHYEYVSSYESFPSFHTT